jgi:membrane protein YqaA with SNARE-associated domain
MLRGLYDRVVELSKGRYALPALAAVSFAESSFFPIPPDVVLVPMALANPHKARLYALVCTIASVLGGLLGYAIGALLYDTLGHWLIHLYGYEEKMDAMREFYAKWGALFILLKGLTPIPFKLVTIFSGLFAYNFPLFILLSLITRGGRFFILAAALTHFGDYLREKMEAHFGLFLGSLAAIVVGGFVIAVKLF